MGKLSQLMRWHTSLVLKDPDGKDLQKVYLRIISDYDLEESFRLARVASAEKRARLRDVDSTDFKDQVLSFNEATEEQCKELITASRENEWQSQALSAVVRPDEIKLSEIAIDPDAPTLEEQEKVDIENRKIDEEYKKSIDDFIEQKKKESEAELNSLSIEELRVLAQVQVVVLLPLTVFYNELVEQKTWRAVYEDKEFTSRGFESVEDFREMYQILREQLISAYAELEEGAGEIKN